MNAINVIAPYRHNGMWVFDDPSKGLDKEPFVAGADTLIDKATAHIADAASGFVMVFSGDEFPGAERKLRWLRKEVNGNVYRDEDLGLDGWLCPALLKYFKKAPKRLFVQVKPKPN